MTPDRWTHVEGLLAEGWSPEQVAGRLRLEGGWTVGRQWTSGRVRADGKAGGKLFPLLRRRGRKPDRRGGRRSGRGHIPGRVDISGRPEGAGSRERVGDREADTIIGRGHSGAVVTLVDRASGFVFLQRADRRTAAAVSAAMLEMPQPSAAPVHTVTSDNGREFAGHAGVAAELGAGFFLPHFHSWERGLDGHTNGLVRQYLPKGTDLRAVTDAQVRAVQDRTDARPRRALGYRTPAEVLHKARPPCARTDATRPGGGVAPPGKPGQPASRRDHSRPGAGSAVPGGRRPRLPAIPSARATPPLREWPVLHFGVEVGTP